MYLRKPSYPQILQKKMRSSENKNFVSDDIDR
nr:MAG TPA: hypothetical protein [Caudoviricetes sp.]